MLSLAYIPYIHGMSSLREEYSCSKCCLDEHQASRTTVLPEEPMLLPTGSSLPTLLGNIADCQAAGPHHTS